NDRRPAMSSGVVRAIGDSQSMPRPTPSLADPSKGHLVLAFAPLVAKLAAVISRGGLLLLVPIEEADAVRHNLRHPPRAAVPRGVAPVLQPPLDGHQAALAQVVGACLGQLAPRHDGKEVCLPLALLVRGRPVHGDAESGHRVALWGVAEV